jgi:hypothetical protein
MVHFVAFNGRELVRHRREDRHALIMPHREVVALDGADDRHVLKAACVVPVLST